MNRLSLLILPLTLSACAASPADRTDALLVPETAVQTVPARPKTTADYMTAQENELRTALAGTPFTLTRHGNILAMVFSGTDVFAENAYQPALTAQEALKKVAPVLASYAKTRISVTGRVFGLKPATCRLLSEKRAAAVANVLKENAKIAPVRLWVEGRGDEKTVAGESGVDRVVIVLTPTFVK